MDGKFSVESCKWMQIAHDLRSPMTALKLVAEKLPAMAEREVIEGVIHRLSDIVSEILGPDENATSPSTWTPSEIFSIVQETQLLFPRVAFEVKIHLMEETKVSFPSACVNRAISNLLNNACEANNSIGTVLVSIRSSAAGFEIDIEDEGKGLPKGFEAGFGVSTKASHRFRGIGLMSSIERIKQFGKIKISNAPKGRGALAQLRLIYG